MGMTDEQRRAAIDAESMETRHDAPQVAQPTKGKRVRVIARTLNGIKQVTANLYELPNYNGPQLAVSEYKSSRGHGYRVYLPKSGAFITDSNGVSSLDDTLKLAVLRIHNARQTIASRAPAAEREQSLKTSAEKARWTRAPAADRLGILGRAGWTVNPPSKATERMQRISWDKMSDSQRQRISAAMEPAASEAAKTTTELQTPAAQQGDTTVSDADVAAYNEAVKTVSDRSFGEPEKPTPDEGKARRTEMVELRKRLSVLEQLRKCL